jgi:hypothetical protein
MACTSKRVTHFHVIMCEAMLRSFYDYYQCCYDQLSCIFCFKYF